jgi:DNA-binding GntR family transcriptional regulator
MLLNHRTLSDHVANLLRRMILNGTLKPGERLNQVHLAEKMEISRGPLREALSMLQNEGLIKHETNRGTFVTTLSKEDAYEIYTLRALLESEAAQLAMDHLTLSDFNHLYHLLDQFHIASSEKDLEKMAQCDMKFHQKIVSASNHKRLMHMHQQLDTQVGAMFVTMANKVPIRVNQAVKNHQILLESLDSKAQKNSKVKENIKKVFSDHYIQALEDLIEIDS